MALAAGTGRLIGELVDGRRPHIDIDAFSVSRF
jgi:glycine/D-amino acid oxidase-like deaminating enzyme